VLATTLVDAVPDHRHELPSDSIWPVLLALVVGATQCTVVFSPWPFVIGVGLSLLVLFGWFWRGGEPPALAKRNVAVEPGPAP
jgi:cytochrome c oxidase subunit I+III